MARNKGFEKVSSSPRSSGKFTSPNLEPLGKSMGLRLPQSLESWITEEAEKQGINKAELIRRLLKEQQQSYQVQQSA